MTKYHVFSFIISSIIYVALGFLFLNILDAKKNIPKPKERVIKIALLRPIPKIITPPTPVVVPIIPPLIIPPQKIVSSKPKPITRKVNKRKKRKVKSKKVKKRKIKKQKVVKKTRKKRVKKRKIKKRVIKKKTSQKRSVKKRIIKKRVIKKHLVKPKPNVREPEPIIEKIYYPPIVREERYIPLVPMVEARVREPEPIIEEVYYPPVVQEERYIPPPPKPAPKIDNRAAKRAFLMQVRSQIINNKRYPKLALRRHIEGSITVRFNIGSSGDVSNIRFISGKTILQKAVRKAILQSFPMGIPSSLRSELPINNVTLTVNFSIN